jgi:outer membrane protein OmpA-like peptidoglycan-associated protein
MKRLEPPPEEPKEFAPLWITTFADLIGQLFSFFVMLLVLGNMQDAGMIGAVRESFVSTIKNFGYGGSLYGKGAQTGPHSKATYSVENPEQTNERTLDAQEADIQAIYQKVMKSVETINGQVVGAKVTYLPKDVRFGRGRAELNEAAQDLLRRDMAGLKADLGERNVKIYVLGLAASEPTDWQQWTISAKRAEAVAEFMRNMLPAGLGWQVYSWGAGKGGEWTGQEGQVSKDSEILVAVLRK